MTAWRLAVASIVAALAVGSAATLGGLAPMSLGAGDAAVLACDSDGLSVDYTTTGGDVTAVTVGGIADPACRDGVLSLRLTGTAGASLAAGGPVTIAGSAVTAPVSPHSDAELVEGVAIQIVGP